MRPIKFKAKGINGNWHEGLLAHDRNGWYISNSAGRPFAYHVRPETICEFTGEVAKKEELYEGDIMFHPKSNRRYLVVFKEAAFYLMHVEADMEGLPWGPLLRAIELEWLKDCTVVSNIHDPKP